ncbi:MAG: hypothetical protein ACU84Q_14045, partial [Gammaproteobacteria bacterium]
MSHQHFFANFSTLGYALICFIPQHLAANSAELPPIRSGADANQTYERAIASIEKERGAHDFALVEPAIGLGVNFQLKNQHEQAIEALKQALHVNRINRGLHDPDHVPIIDLISHSHVQLGDWESADKQQQLRYWIYKREIETVENISTDLLNNYVDATLHFTNWQGQTFRRDTDRFPLVKLRQAQLALNDARARMNSRNLTRDERYLNLLNASAVNNYNIVVHLSDNEVDPVSGSYAGDQDISDYLLRKNVMMDSYRQGTEALHEVMSITAMENQQIRHATAILNYADWQLLFNRPQTAAQEYERAFGEFLKAGSEKTELNKRFSEP